MTANRHSPIRDTRPAACEGRVHAQSRPLAAGADAAALHDLLTDGGKAPGSLLLESADVGGRSGTGSLLFPAPVLRLLLHGEQLRVEALDPRGRALLPLLAKRLPGPVTAGAAGLETTVPRPSRDPARTDRERLLSPSAFDAVRALCRLVGDRLVGEPVGEPPITVAGAFAYELVDHFEALPPRPPDPLAEPDLNLVLALDGIFYDHRASKVTVTTRALRGTTLDERRERRDAEDRLSSWLEALATARPPADEGSSPAEPALPSYTAEPAEAAFLASIDRLLGHIQAGDVFQGVLSRSLDVPSEAPPFSVYRELRAGNPSPYMFHFELGDGVLLGASPETCLCVREGRAMLAPIAGTVPRGLGPDGSIDADLDGRLAVALMLDPKEQAEHAMLIDLARNDLARICVPGTREVEAPFSIERYSHVQHLVTRVTGELDRGLDALDAYRATANAGTLTGAPKLRAMEIIRELEPTARGFYGGAIGYLTATGDFDSCIVIRSLRHAGGVYHLRSGAGIVADSRPARELAETLQKARAPLAAIARAEEKGR